MRWWMPEGTEQAVLKLQATSQGGFYGSSEGQDEEEGSSKEESSWQEKEVGNILSEAIH